MNNKYIIFFMPFIGGGGVEKNLFIISNFISKKINNVYICTSSIKYKKKFNREIKFLVPKQKIIERLSLRIKYFTCLLILFKFLIKKRNTLVVSFQANIYCILLCKILRVKIISRSNSSPSGWSHNFLKKYIYKTIINSADEVITNSMEFKKEMNYNFNLRTTCIYNPLDSKNIQIKSYFKSKNYFGKTNKIKLLSIGRLTEQKDHLTLLRSAKLLKEKKIPFKMIIAGRGIERPNLQRFIMKHNLYNDVKIINFLDNPYPLIKQAELFILSSKYEGLPNVLLESAVLKTPIISTDCPTGPKEILINGKGGYLFKIGDFKKLTEIILSFYKNKKKFTAKSYFLNNNLKRFDYKNNLQKYLRLIQKHYLKIR